MAAPDPFKAFNQSAAKNGWACTCDPALVFSKSKLALVAKLWRDRAGPHSVPKRADFDARSLMPVITNTTIIEKVSNRYRIRLHGTALTQYAGDYTGKFVDDVIPKDHADGYIALYDLVLKEGRPLRVVWDYQVPAVSYLMGESFVGPISGSDGQPNQVLSVTYATSKARALAAA